MNQLKLYKYQNITAVGSGQLTAWVLIRNECVKFNLPIPLVESIEFVKDLSAEEMAVIQERMQPERCDTDKTILEQIENYGAVAELPEFIADALQMDKDEFMADFYNPISSIAQAYEKGLNKIIYARKLLLYKEATSGKAFQYEAFLEKQKINEFKNSLWGSNIFPV